MAQREPDEEIRKPISAPVAHDSDDELGAEEPAQSARAGNKNASFWDRDNIRGARNAADIWASCKWARLCGNPRLPMLETIFEVPRPILASSADWDDFHGWKDYEMGVRTETTGAFSRARVFELFVDAAIHPMGRMTEELMLNLYPRCGPYQRPAYGEDLLDPVYSMIRRYRPSWVFGSNFSRGKYFDDRLDTLLANLHRDALVAIAAAGRTPAEVFEAHVRSIQVPPDPKPEKESPRLCPHCGVGYLCRRNELYVCPICKNHLSPDPAKPQPRKFPKTKKRG